MSTVTFSTPLALRDAVYSLTFGDGDSDVMYPPIGLSQVTRAWHTYRTSGEFTAQLTVTGANGGRLATGSTTVTVRSLAGAWSNTDVNNATNRSEARRFELTQQGSALSGRYLGPDGVARAAAGTLSAERSIRLTVDGQMVASGIDLDRDGISDDASAFTVVFAGLGATGRRLTFVREK